MLRHGNTTCNLIIIAEVERRKKLKIRNVRYPDNKIYNLKKIGDWLLSQEVYGPCLPNAFCTGGYHLIIFVDANKHDVGK